MKSIARIPRPLLPALALLLAASLAACGEGAVRDAGDPAIVPAAAAAAQAETGVFDLATIGHAQGAEDAPVTVYEFSDFGCRFCALFSQGTYPELHREFVATGKVRWVSVPFVMGMFPNGETAARASECAAEQEQFFAMHDRLFAGQSEWARSKEPEQIFAGYAKQIGLDAARFTSCYAVRRGALRTANNTHAAELFGIRATPTFIVDGRMVEGALPIQQFRQLLRAVTGAE